MKRRKLLTVAAALVVVAAAAIGFWWWQQTPWPTFPPAPAEAAGQPQVIVQYKRDYAYRIGDAIAVDIYIKQPKDITVSPGSLAIGADFEVMGAPQVEQQQLPDGGVVQHIRLKLQSFKMKPELVLDGTLGYNRDGVRQELKIPSHSLYTSKTYDGRKDLQEGDDVRVSFFWYGGRHIVPLLLGSLAFLAMCLAAVRNWRPSPKTVTERRLNRERQRVLSLVAAIRSGERTASHHIELEALVRNRWKIGPIAASLMTEAEYSAELIELLRLNSPALYSANKPDGITIERLCTLAENLARDWSKYAD